MMRKRIAAFAGFLLLAAGPAYAALRAPALNGGEPQTMLLVGAVLVAVASMRNKRRNP